MNKIKSALTIAALAATAGGMALAGAGDALAQGSPTPWISGGQSADPNAVGGMEFFDGSGNQITTGASDTAPYAGYTVGLSTLRAGDNKAQLFLCTPQPGVDPSLWTCNTLVATSSSYPNAAAPSPVGATTLPVNTGKSIDQAIEDITSVNPTSSNAGYDGVYELRQYTIKSGSTATIKYNYADIKVDSGAHTWSLVWSPDQAGTATSSTVMADHTSVNQGDPVQLTDTVAPSGATGTVQFKDSGTNIGSPVTVSGGVATQTFTPATSGPHAVTAVFTPSALSGYAASTSSPLTVNAAKVVSNTSVALAINPTSGPAFSAVQLTATPSPAVPGVVKFFDGGAQIGTANTTGAAASITYSGFAQGDHPNITASFTPNDLTSYNTSTSAAVDFNAGAPAGAAPDVQNIDADVAAGALSITTPYHAGNSLHVGTLSLNANGTELSGSAQFGDGTTPDGSIKIVDTRAGNTNWTASAASSDLVDTAGDSINQQNVGLTDLHGIYTAGNALQSGKVTFTNNAAADPAVAPGATGTAGLGGGAHEFARTNAGGDGTVGIYGTLTITAPTSTKAGHYAGTVTFTVA